MTKQEYKYFYEAFTLFKLVYDRLFYYDLGKEIKSDCRRILIRLCQIDTPYREKYEKDEKIQQYRKKIKEVLEHDQ